MPAEWISFTSCPAAGPAAAEAHAHDVGTARRRPTRTPAAGDSNGPAVTGALVNAAAIVRYIRSRAPEVVTLVRMGHEARERCDEDDLCAELHEADFGGRRRAFLSMPWTGPDAAGQAQQYFVWGATAAMVRKAYVS